MGYFMSCDLAAYKNNCGDVVLAEYVLCIMVHESIQGLHVMFTDTNWKGHVKDSSDVIFRITT